MGATRDRLAELGIDLPHPPPPAYSYVSALRHGNLVYCSGHTATEDGRLLWQGKVGAEVSVDEAQQAARQCALNCLGAVEQLLGDLDQVAAVLKLTGYVASAPGFVDQPAVVNGASLLVEQVLGDRGRHARTALGLAELPGGSPVEVDLVLALR